MTTRLKALALEAHDKGLYAWKPKTAAAKARRTAIIKELSNLSRDGWSGAIAADYEHLERELRLIEA